MYYFIYYSTKHTIDNFFDDFLKIYKQFTKISEDSPKVVWAPDNRFNLYIFWSFLITEEELMMIWSYRNKSKYFLRYYVTIAMMIFSLL